MTVACDNGRGSSLAITSEQRNSQRHCGEDRGDRKMFCSWVLKDVVIQGVGPFRDISLNLPSGPWFEKTWKPRQVDRQENAGVWREK
jgi:hypothetical protein